VISGNARGRSATGMVGFVVSFHGCVAGFLAAAAVVLLCSTHSPAVTWLVFYFSLLGHDHGHPFWKFHRSLGVY